MDEQKKIRFLGFVFVVTILRLNIFFENASKAGEFMKSFYVISLIGLHLLTSCRTTSPSARSQNDTLPGSAAPKAEIAPSAVSSKALPTQPKLCTQIVGTLFNPVNSQCVDYTDGCQRSDLMNLGYVQASGAQCK